MFSYVITYPLVYAHFCYTISNVENAYSYHWNKLTVNAQATCEGNRWNYCTTNVLWYNEHVMNITVYVE